MSGTRTCTDCGESYHDGGTHDCPGSPDDRICSLEQDVAQLEERVAKLETLLWPFTGST